MPEEKPINLALISQEELTKAATSVLNENQLQFILTKTPEKYIQTRPAKGGGRWKFVSGGYIKKCLNLMFGFDWDFEIIDEKILIEAKQVIVKGRLTCRVGHKAIIKMHYGRKDIAFRKDTSDPLDLGNDLKAAATDCLKKCASEIGIAADIYNANEFKEVFIKEVITNHQNAMD